MTDPDPLGFRNHNGIFEGPGTQLLKDAEQGPGGLVGAQGVGERQDQDPGMVPTGTQSKVQEGRVTGDQELPVFLGVRKDLRIPRRTESTGPDVLDLIAVFGEDLGRGPRDRVIQ